MDTDLEILIRAIADEKSADEATKQLVNRVFSKLKDDAIKLPINSELDKSELKKLDDNMKQARKEVVRRYNKLQKEMANPEGFDAFSDKAINELIELGKAYATFNSKAGGRSKNSMKAIADVKSALGEVFQLYENELKLLNSKIKELNLQDKVSRQLSSTRSRRSSKSAEAYDRYLTKQEQHSKRAEGAGKRKELFNELDEVRKEKSQYPQHIIRGVATKKTLQETEYSGSYPSGFARQMAKSRREARKQELASLKVEKNKEKAEELSANATRGRLVKEPTNEEINELKRDVTTNELAKILGGIEHQRKDVSVQLFKDYMAGAFTFNKASGNNDWKVIQETLEKTLNRYRGDKGTLGITDGTQKGVFGGHEEAVQAIQEMLDYMREIAEQSEEISGVSVESARQLREMARIDPKAANKFADELLGRAIPKKAKSTVADNSVLAKEIKAEARKLKQANNETFDAVRKGTGATEKQLSYDRIEAAREGVADRKAGEADRDTINKLEQDMTTGFNTDTESDALIDIGKQIKIVLDSISETLTGLVSDGIPTRPIEEAGKKGNISGLPVPLVYNAETKSFEKTSVKDEPVDYTDPKNQGLKITQSVEFSESEIKTYSKGLKGIFEKVFEGFKYPSEADRIMSMNKKEQSRMYAQRLETYGMNRGKNMTDTGDIADVKRTKSLFGWIYKNDEKNKQLFQNVKLTPGFTGDSAINTTAIMESLNKVLSGPEMFKAQTGGVLRNLVGSVTGYIGMPSLEKSRAQAEGLNQVMAKVRNEVLSLVQDIQRKETALAGMKELGTAKFTKDGQITSDSSLVAQNTFTKLEEQKGVLKAALAEVGAIDKVVSKSGGKISKIVKKIGFVMPELLDQNTILQNINAGLDKNGKALKFQSRTAEILNYSFQLMTRHIGQMVKNWMLQLNPITQIKKLFSDFSGYNTKWQRTMNVVKYNLRSIVLPMIEKIAQLLVNMIGFADIILQKVQAAFGKTPISLFDQENAKKFKDEVEQINSISAGFDELHDIGSDTDKDPNNLLGEIYKPQLSQEWIDLANEIGDLFAGVITGDLGFGEAMGKILGIAWEGIKLIGKEIWNAIKNSTIGQYIQKHWLEILANIAAAFLAWKFLKWAGGKLLEAIFGKLTLSNITSFLGSGLKKIGSSLWNLLGLNTFGQQMQVGFLQAFKGQGLIGALKGGGATLGSVFAQAFIAVAGVAIAGISYAKGFDMAADDYAYNKALMESGGNKEDKKTYAGAAAVSGLGGAAGGALIGLALGGPVGAAIGAGVGAIVGLISNSLVPIFEEAEIAARDMNNEMQKIEYYQGKVQGYSTQVSELTELQKVLNDTLKLQTENVYKEGEQLGITKERMNELVTAVQNGTFHTGMLTGAEMGLKDSLIQLDAQQTKNKEATEKLETAKRKLQKAELDLAIAEDIAAGNFEMAAARVEYAVAAEIYDVEEGTKKMVQIAKEGSAEQASAMLRDMSPDLQAKFQKEYSTTEKGLNELTDLYFEYSKDERDYFLQNLTGEVQREMQSRVSAIEQAVKNAPWYMRLLDIGNDGKIFGQSYVDVPGYATGTNYVPSDGLAYLHKGEAVIPAKYNEGIGVQGKAYQEQAHVNNQLMTAIARLENTMKQGITVNGQFVQRGSDLVAVVNKTKSQTGADLLSNVSYAR